MPNKDTSLAIQQAIYWSEMMGTIQPGFYINMGFQCFNTKQGHKPSYTTSYKLIRNDEDNPICLSKQGFSLTIHKLDINPKLKGRLTWIQASGFQIYSHAVNRTELIYKLNFI